MGGLQSEILCSYDSHEEAECAREKPTRDAGSVRARVPVRLARVVRRGSAGKAQWVYDGETGEVDVYGRRRVIQSGLDQFAWWRLEVLAARGTQHLTNMRRTHHVTVAEWPWSSRWCRNTPLRRAADRAKEDVATELVATSLEECMQAVDHADEDPFVTGKHWIASVSDPMASLEIGSDKDDRTRLVYVFGVCEDLSMAKAEVLTHASWDAFRSRALSGELLDARVARKGKDGKLERVPAAAVPERLRTEAYVDRIIDLAVEQAFAGPPSAKAADRLDGKGVHVLASQIARDHFSRDRKLDWRSSLSNPDNIDRGNREEHQRAEASKSEQEVDRVSRLLRTDDRFRRQCAERLVDGRWQFETERESGDDE